MQKHAKKRSVGLLIGSLVVLCIGGTLIGLTVIEVNRLIELRGSKEIQGTVTNKRELANPKNSRSYDIQYQFSIGEEKYFASDATGREDLWIGIPKEFFDTLEIGDKIAIAYSPENPNANRPVLASSKIGDTIAGGFLGLFLFVFGLLLFIPK